MKNLSLKIITILFIIFSYQIAAQEYDEGRYNQVLKQLKLNSSKVESHFYTEKKMPNAEDSYIIVVPVLKEKEGDDYFLLQNYILITDEKGKIKNQFFDPEEITSDAIMLQNFTIDTGLYNLTSTIRAFGVSANYRGSSRPNPYGAADMSMYYPTGKTLKKVLNQYPIVKSGGEWDMACTGEFYDDVSVIILDKTKTNGFSNLKIKTTHTTTISKEINGECDEKETSKISYKTLKFNKSIYK